MASKNRKSSTSIADFISNSVQRSDLVNGERSHSASRSGITAEDRGIGAPNGRLIEVELTECSRWFYCPFHFLDLFCILSQIAISRNESDESGWYCSNNHYRTREESVSLQLLHRWSSWFPCSFIWTHYSRMYEWMMPEWSFGSVHVLESERFRSNCPFFET
jgi:hypothetical protein